MKILLIHNYGQYRGGAETYFESLSKQLKAKGHRVITYAQDSRKIKTLFDKITTAIGMFYSSKTKKELEELIEKEKPDVAQILNIYPLISATIYWVLKKHKIPIIQRIQDYRYFCPKATLFRNQKICELCLTKRFKYPSVIYGCYQSSRLSSLIFSLSFYFHQLIGSYQFIDKYIFPTKFVRDFYIKNGKIKKEKTIIIPTFTDINQSKSKGLISLKNKNNFLFFGRLSEEKGIIKLLQVFKKLPKIRLTVIGDGPLKNEIQQYSRYKNITIIGFQPRNIILEYIRQAKAVIIPSLWYDVMPNVLIESISQGTPVIVPKFGVFPELVKENDGFFYEQDDFDNLKSIIIQINRRKKLELINNHRFIPERHIDKLIGLYKNLKYEKN
ncbi:MAG: glycosyltransferase family 4 protein [Patescibacteria group bacterium]|mgnify:CR=1 FL=1